MAAQKSSAQQSMIVVYPGSFDPPTNGHLDMIERAAGLFSKVIVLVGANDEKKDTALLTGQERVALLKDLCKKWANVEVVARPGLTAEEARKLGAGAIVRGLRSSEDYLKEVNMATMNRHLGKDLETLFLPADSKYSHVSSTLIKEVARFGGDVTGLCPPYSCP